MERADLLERARQGDPGAIAAILNQQLKYQAIECRATVVDRLLHLVFRAEDTTPDRSELLDFVRAKLMNLDIENLARVRLYGRDPGAESEPQSLPEAAVWTHEFALAVGSYSQLIAARASEMSDAGEVAGSASSDGSGAVAGGVRRTKKQPTPLSLAIVAIALGLVVFSGYRIASRNAEPSPPQAAPAAP
ncbi:MAG: hypothetical protein ACFB9N_00995 [Geitlerinemataceae cyanobacterium]